MAPLVRGWRRRRRHGQASRRPVRAGEADDDKVKVERTADCVVAGFRTYVGGPLASLLLGLYDDASVLRHVGVCSAFSDQRRYELFEQLWPQAVSLRGHPWEAGFGLERSAVGRLKGAAGRWHPGMTMDWIPIAPLVAEVAYDMVDDQRLRHRSSAAGDRTATPAPAHSTS